ncbi:MAG: Cd(II)/Pb(II)-responsive transcriptional regulator [Desulfovibrio sp.]|jgi:Cd(II)/Pb(II)-responsive transcriptional regulator|nr:Cd(II)/Pb(II)-responsive transcriptional regulator [Desulfovibrio sp.]
MKIGELAKRTGCKVVTIRYYEKEGLLAEPDRTGGNYRSYGRGDLERLEFIMHCRRHGMQLGEIRKLLAFRDQPRSDCTWVGKLIDAHIENVDGQIKSLEHLKLHLEMLRQSCACGGSGETCGIMRNLENREESCIACAHCPPEAGHPPSGSLRFTAPPEGLMPSRDR